MDYFLGDGFLFCVNHYDFFAWLNGIRHKYPKKRNNIQKHAEAVNA
jgi:hypothetical protein